MYDSDFNDAGSDLTTVERPVSGGAGEVEAERPDSAEVDGEWGMYIHFSYTHGEIITHFKICSLIFLFNIFRITIFD